MHSPHAQAADTDSVYPDFVWFIPDWTFSTLWTGNGPFCSSNKTRRFLDKVVVVSPSYNSSGAALVCYCTGAVWCVTARVLYGVLLHGAVWCVTAQVLYGVLLHGCCMVCYCTGAVWCVTARVLYGVLLHRCCMVCYCTGAVWCVTAWVLYGVLLHGCCMEAIQTLCVGCPGQHRAVTGNQSPIHDAIESQKIETHLHALDIYQLLVLQTHKVYTTYLLLMHRCRNTCTRMCSKDLLTSLNYFYQFTCGKNTSGLVANVHACSHN